MDYILFFYVLFCLIFSRQCKVFCTSRPNYHPFHVLSCHLWKNAQFHQVTQQELADKYQNNINKKKWLIKVYLIINVCVLTLGTWLGLTNLSLISTSFTHSSNQPFIVLLTLIVSLSADSTLSPGVTFCYCASDDPTALICIVMKEPNYRLVQTRCQHRRDAQSK